MVPLQYLDGVEIDHFEGLTGVYAVPHYKRGNHYRYICSYRDGKAHKRYIFNLLTKYGQKENPKDWDLHHIVEGQHFADIDFMGKLQKMYQEELPCVLIHNQEHRAYNSLLHIGATDELYRDQLPKALLQRSQAAAAAFQKADQYTLLRNRLTKLESLYLNAYSGDPALSRIAENVLNGAKKLLLAHR